MAYATTIVEVGAEAPAFLDERMAITFAGNAPEELRPFCFLIETALLEGALALGQNVSIGAQVWQVTALGAAAQQNLVNLGHVTLVFDGATTARMPGALHLGGCNEVPALVLGAKLVFHCD